MICQLYFKQVFVVTGVLWLSVQNVYGIKATSLIFGKPSTTTTSPDGAAEEGVNVSSKIINLKIVCTANNLESANIKQNLKLHYVNNYTQHWLFS